MLGLQVCTSRFHRSQEASNHVYFLHSLPFLKPPGLISQSVGGIPRLVGIIILSNPPFSRKDVALQVAARWWERPPLPLGRGNPRQPSSPVCSISQVHRCGSAQSYDQVPPFQCQKDLSFRTTQCWAFGHVLAVKGGMSQSTFGSWGRGPCKQITVKTGKVTKSIRNVYDHKWRPDSFF